MLTIVDNYDSFLHNLARYARRLGVEVAILRNDAPQLEETISSSSALIISPGPCSPKEAGKCLEVVRQFSGRTPILGVCLGHQAIYQALGGRITLANQPMHGTVSSMEFSDSRLFSGIPSPSEFARYHSLICDESAMPTQLRVTARSVDSGEIMAIEHLDHPTFGVQFHPESVLSKAGYRILANFLVLAKLIPENPLLPDNDAQAPSQALVPQDYYAEQAEGEWVEYPTPRKPTPRKVTPGNAL